VIAIFAVQLSAIFFKVSCILFCCRVRFTLAVNLYSSNKKQRKMSVCAKSVSNAALYELGAVGVEERYTVCDPQKSFFVQCSSRHTNFAFAQLDIEAKHPVSNLGYWTEGHVLDYEMPKHGDLLLGLWSRMRLGRLTLPVDVITRADNAGLTKNAQLWNERDEDVSLHWCEEVGFAAIKEAEWRVGSSVLDRLEAEALHMYHEQGTKEGRILRNAIGKQRTGNYINSSYTNTGGLRTFSASDRTLYTPLLFSFMRNVENAFPHVAIQHNEIRFQLTLRARSNLISAFDVSAGEDAKVALNKNNPALNTGAATDSVTGGALIESALTAELAFLSKPEQESYTRSSFHKYYEYTQKSAPIRVNANDKTVQIANLGFNHSIVQLNVAYRATSKTAAYEYFDFSTVLPVSVAPSSVPGDSNDPLDPLENQTGLSRDLNPFECIELLYNSAPRVSRQGVYMHECVPFMRHNRIDDSFSCVYSFAIDPESHNGPTGSSNIGRFTTTPLKLTFIDSAEGVPLGTFGSGILEGGEVRVYALTQGFYKIAGGQLALRWSGP